MCFKKGETGGIPIDIYHLCRYIPLDPSHHQFLRLFRFSKVFLENSWQLVTSQSLNLLPPFSRRIEFVYKILFFYIKSKQSVYARKDFDLQSFRYLSKEPAIKDRTGGLN